MAGRDYNGVDTMLEDIFSIAWQGAGLDPELIRLAIERTKDRDPYRILSWLIGMGLVSASPGIFQEVRQYLAMHRTE